MELLTQQEAASMLGVSIRTVERFRQTGRLKTIRLSYRTIRIPKLDVEKLIEGSRWNGNRQDNNVGKATIDTTFTTMKMDIVKEFQQGRMIWKKQKLVSLHGKKSTTSKL